MTVITLPDGSTKEFNGHTNGTNIASSIGAGLLKAAVAVEVDGVQKDMEEPITTDATVALLTAKTAGGLDVIRHTTTAQVLARAVKELYPTAKLAIGPTVEHGFYYDVMFEKALSSEDLPKIEQKMRDIIGQKNEIKREEWPVADVRAYFEKRGETYKIDIIDRVIEKDQLLEGGKLSVFRQLDKDGNELFLDLCVGPHAKNLGQISKAFTLTNIAGAYWRGDSNNDMLTRIYGVQFAEKDALKAHLHMLEEAAKRDHRRLGKDLGLFHFEEHAPGQVFWHDKGWRVYQNLMKYMRETVREKGYIEVNTPQMMNLDFWKWSGHWDKYKENMFVVDESKDENYALKPMNCPGNVQIFKQGTKSYRDLPVRMAEFGKVFRHEPSGARHGLMRVQSFTQDDAHIFCTPEQLEDEIIDMCDLIEEVYNTLGFTNIQVKFSTRPEERIGDEADWDKAETILQKVCDKLSLPWELNEGDGAFYAPKLDFVLTDAIGREWQCGTIQVDMNLPTRLDITYHGANGEKQRPYMVHRAIMGSIERFLGVMIEHYAANFPLWLAPLQVITMGITDKQNSAVKKLTDRLKNAGLHVEADLRNEKVSYKIREHSVQKIPYIFVVGDREIENDTVTIRRFGSQKQTTMSTDDAITMLQKEIATKALPEKHTEDQEAA